MKLREMLALIGGPTFLDDRVERLSGASDELFDDDTITVHLNEGVRRLCDEGWVLEDTTTAAVCEIDLTQNVVDYDVHESVLGIKYVRLSDSDVDLLRVGYDDNRLHNIRSLNEPDYWDVNVALTETPGRPTRWSADIGTHILRLRAPPDATAAALKAKLAVVRMPTDDEELSTGQPDASPVVPKSYHMVLCKYAAGCCATGGDVDGALVAKGRRWLSEFEADIKKARRQRERFQQSAPTWRFGGWANGN